jgi:hypothetical protein
MYPFVILSSLSVGFYLVMLVALHRDAKRHRRHVTVTHPTSFGGRIRIRLARTKVHTAGGRTPDSSGDVIWRPVTKIQWKPADRPVEAMQRKSVIAASSASPFGR